MRIGVVCEGPTDFVAIEQFFGHELERQGVIPEFLDIQPNMDNTNPESGWGNVLLWFQKNPPKTRIQKYLSGGLFGGGLSFKPVDCFLIQLDSDILADHSFVTYVQQNLGVVVQLPHDRNSNARAQEIRNVVARAAKFDELTHSDVLRHVVAPAVESTENWCVAAFTLPTRDFEQMSGADLANAFMSALERSERRSPEMAYLNIDKQLSRRRRFCELHRTNSDRVVSGCRNFEVARDELLDLIPE